MVFCLLFLADNWLASGSRCNSVTEFIETSGRDSRVRRNGPGFSNNPIRTHTSVESTHTGWIKALRFCRYIHHMAAHVVLISFALHPSGHYLYLILLTGSWGAGTSSECVMQKGGTTDENDEKRLTGLASVCSTNTRHLSLSFHLRTRIHFTFKLHSALNPMISSFLK